MANELFVHILLFECPQCGGPIESVVTIESSNPEQIDAQEMQLRCKCNWAGQSYGFAAKRRLVVVWEPQNAQRIHSVDRTVLGMYSKERRPDAVRPKN